jgi:hypothetical protein
MKTFGWKLFASIAVLALAALACGMPDVSSLLSTTPSDDFSNSGSGWGTGTDSSSSVEYTNGGLQMIVYTPFYVTWSTPDTTVYENIHMEVNVKNDSTDPEALFGFVCNEQGSTNAFYYVGVSPDGYYAFIKSSVAVEDVFLKEGTSTVISGSPSSMRLGLDCGNGSMTLYVNGQQIDSVSDSSYTNGVVGLFAASDDQDSGANVTFDDFTSSQLGQ